jgi:hypothetical protein
VFGGIRFSQGTDSMFLMLPISVDQIAQERLNSLWKPRTKSYFNGNCGDSKYSYAFRHRWPDHSKTTRNSNCPWPSQHRTRRLRPFSLLSDLVGQLHTDPEVDNSEHNPIWRGICGMEQSSFPDIHTHTQVHCLSLQYKITHQEFGRSAIHQPLAISLRNAKQPSDGSNGCSANRLIFSKCSLYPGPSSHKVF